MKAKDLLLPLTLALITTWAFQYYWGGKSDADSSRTDRSGQQFTAPKSTDVYTHKPLNLEIDFVDTKPNRKREETTIETDHAVYVFSNDGASLERLTYKQWQKEKGPITTVKLSDPLQKENQCFLVALGEKTPYYFDYVDQKEDEYTHSITYKADFGDGVLTKTFVVSKNIYQIDLNISIEPKTGIENAIQPRVLFCPPHLKQLGKSDVVSAIANDEYNKVQIYTRLDQAANSYWVKPTLFGSQDRYFVHSLVGDESDFVQRGYFKFTRENNVQSILEGPTVDKKTSWSLRFYVGPKIEHAMTAVDTRLVQTINYGFLPIISKPISKVMLNLLNVLNRYLHDYGLAIIVLTILMRLLMLPFTMKTQSAMKKQAEVSKKLQYLEKKYKHDKEALAQAKADVIKKHGLPAVGGCLPLLFQLPLFWGLSSVLSSSIELYRAPFLWISDLSSPDPYYILPALAGIFMILGGASGQGGAQKRIGSIAMGLFVAALFANFSAGLVLYITVSTGLGVLQNQLMKHFK